MMFSVLSRDTIIVPIMSLEQFPHTKYGPLLCVLRYMYQLRCEWLAVRAPVGPRVSIFVMKSQQWPSTSEVVRMCVWICYCGMKASHCWACFSHWHRKTRLMAAAEVTSKSVCLFVFSSLHLCIWTCLNILHKHVCLSCVIYVFH